LVFEISCLQYDVNAIQKNGGKITADIPNAAFVILNPRSVSYIDLRQEADDSARTIVQTSFVTESVKQGHLLDPNDFLLGDASSPRRLNWSSHRPTSKRDRPSPESDHVTSEPPTSDTVVDSATAIHARVRSGTPEPPAAVQSKNGFRFTPAEMSYAWAMVRRIILKDQMASKMVVIRALHEKVCWAGTPLWTAHLTHTAC
jgi:BRCT domain, a BRCA1 C-terminus domain